MSSKAVLQSVQRKVVDVAAGEHVAAVEVSRSVFCMNIIDVLRSGVLVGRISQGMRPCVVQCHQVIVACSPLPLGLKRMIVRLESGGRNIDGPEAAIRSHIVKEPAISKVNRALCQNSRGEIGARTWLVNIHTCGWVQRSAAVVSDIKQ